jgi:hypothetical protein
MHIPNRVFITVFILIIFIPLVFVDLSSDRVSIQENRMLAGRPSFSDIKNRPEVFISQFDSWFKDNNGFREQLVSLYNIINKNGLLNGVQYTDGQFIYLIGEQGHHYFADVNGRLIPKFQGKGFLSDELLQNMATKLEEVKTYLNNKGIPLVVMFCTDKESIYPEFYPKSIIRGSEPIELEVITKYLQTHTNVDVFNIRQALLARKNDYLLYPLIDTLYYTSITAHYNELGAFFAYHELAKYINAFLPQIIPYELSDVEIYYDEKEMPSVLFREKKTYKQLEESFFDDVNLEGYFIFENDVFENIESDLPVILFLRDSYAQEQYIGKYFAQQFSKAIFIHYKNFKYFEEYINLYKPDIVVFESAERALTGFANYVITIPKL